MYRSAPAVLAAFGVVGVVLHGGAAALDYNETIDGDLSNDQFNPTLLALDLGTNTIAGTTTNDNGVTPLDRDFFVVQVGAGQTLVSLTLDEIITDPVFNTFFMAVDDQVGFDSLINPNGFLGFNIFGLERLNENVLDILEGEDGPVGPLGPGTYTFWYQETGSPTQYAFTATLVPEPGSAIALLLGAGGLLTRRRRAIR
jgi:hypothetical protein